MSILDPGDFKKHFEKAERYATAALEIKKLADGRKALKDMKAGAARLSQAKAFDVQLGKSIKTLKAWEGGLSAPFKALVVSKKLFAELTAESAALAKLIAKDDAAQPVDTGGPSIAGQVGAQKVALVNLENDLAALEQYGNRLRQALPKLRDGTIAPADALALETAGKQQLDVARRLKATYQKSRADFSAMAGPGKNLGPADKDAIKDVLKTLGDYLRKVDGVPDIPAALDELKAARKRMADNKAGLTALFAQATAQVDDVAKALKALEDTSASVNELVDGLAQRYPATAPANTLRERHDSLRDLKRTIEFRMRTLGQESGTASEKVDGLVKRTGKLLGADAYKDLAATDREVAATGTAIGKSAKDLAARMATARAVAAQATTGGNTALAFVATRLPDYIDALAKIELAKKKPK